MRTLLIDDMRQSHYITRTARTYDDGIKALTEEGPWNVLYLDHDLGETDPAKTGEGIMRFLEENPQYLPEDIVMISSNPVGRQRMRVIIDKLYGKEDV